MFYAPQFSKGTETAVAGISRIRLAGEIIAHLMAMIRSQRKTHSPALLHFKDSLHHFININITFKKICLVEIAFLITLGAAKMDKTDSVTEFAHHGRAVIVRTDTERPCT